MEIIKDMAENNFRICGADIPVCLEPWQTGMSAPPTKSGGYISRVPNPRAGFTPRQKSMWKVGKVTFYLCLLLVGFPQFPESQACDSQMPNLNKAKIIQTIKERIKENDSKIKSLQFRAEYVVENAGVKKEETVVTEFPNGAKSIVVHYPKRTFTYSFVIQGGNFRRTFCQGGKDCEMVIVNRRKVLKYWPAQKQATLSRVDNGDEDHTHPLCFGFDPEITSVSNWLQKVEITQVQITENKVGGEEIIIKTVNKEGKLAAVTFSSNYGYLPTNICFYGKDGNLLKNSELTYRRIPKTKTWFSKRIVQKYYGPGKTGDWVSKITIKVVDDVHVNQHIPSETFDPILPAGTLFRDHFAKITLRTEERVRAFSGVRPAIRKIQ